MCKPLALPLFHLLGPESTNMGWLWSSACLVMLTPEQR